MNPRCKSRFVVVICLLLLGQEFARARHLNAEFQDRFGEQVSGDYTDVNNEIQEDDKGDEENEGMVDSYAHQADSSLVSQLHRQSPTNEQGGEKRFFSFSSAVKLFKVFAIGASFFVSTVSLAAAIYQVIEGCCGPGQEEACSYREKFIATIKRVDSLSDKANKLQTKAKITYMWIDKVADKFSKILRELDRIDAKLDKLIQEISPDVFNATKNADSAIQALIDRKNKNKESIPFVDVNRLYKSTFESSLDITANVLGVAIPGAYGIYQYSKYRSRMRRLGYKELENDVDFDLPDDGSSDFKEAKFGKWQTLKGGKFVSGVPSFKERMTTKFKAARKKAGKFLGPMGAAASLALAGYSLYKTINSLMECRTIQEKVKNAYINATKAEKIIKSNIADIENRTLIMTEAWGYVRSNLTDENFLKLLNMTKNMVAGAANQSLAMQSVAYDINDFKTSINVSDDYNMTWDASAKLYTALTNIPFSIECHRSKIRILNKVNTGCKSGKSSFKELLQKSRSQYDKNDENNPDNPQNCKDSLGYLYMDDEVVEKTWYDLAKKKGFHRICYMNDITNREAICRRMKQYEENPKQIADYLKLDEYAVKNVNDILLRYPAPFEKEDICMWREDPETAEADLKEIYFDKGYDRESVYAVKCPVSEADAKGNCVPNEALPPAVRSH